MSKVEAQTWLALRQLLFNNAVMRGYEWNDFRCREISKCLGLINDVLLDQLTPLIQLKQHLATLAIQKPAPGGSGRATFLLLEEIPELQTEFLKEIEAFGQKKMIKMQRQLFFDRAITSAMAKQLNEAYNIERIVELQGEEQRSEPGKPLHPTCGACSQPAEKKCSNCELVFYCCRDCQVKHWAAHKTFCKTNARKQ